jgi:hypothetical protein
MKLRILPEDGGAAMWEALEGKIVIVRGYGNSGPRIWRDPEKQFGAIDDVSFVIGTDALPVTMWVEAAAPGTGRVTATIKDSLYASTSLTEDTVQTQSNEKFIALLDFNGGTHEEESYDNHGLPQSLWQAIFAARQGWQNGWGEPTLPAVSFPYAPAEYAARLETLIDAARLFLDHPTDEDVEGYIARLNEWEADPTKTDAEIATAITDALFKFDEYIFALRKVLIAQREYLDHSLLIVADPELIEDAAALPLHVDGLPGGKTPEQYAGLRKDLAGLGRSLGAMDYRLRVLQGAVQGAAVTFVAGGFGGALALAAIPYVGTAAVIGFSSGMFSTFGASNVYSRYNEGSDGWEDAALAGIADSIGVTSAYISWYGFDPVTGRKITGEEY